MLSKENLKGTGTSQYPKIITLNEKSRLVTE
jgi:hypothetical protein